jgi:hypothetical protein
MVAAEGKAQFRNPKEIMKLRDSKQFLLTRWVLFIMFRSPSFFYLLVHSRCRVLFYFHLITFKHTPQSVGFLWARDRPIARPLPDNTNTVQETNIHAPGMFRTHDPSKRSALDLGLRPRGHWDRHLCVMQ